MIQVISISKNQTAVTDIAQVHCKCKIHMCINTLEHVLIVNKVKDDDELPTEAEEGSCLGLFHSSKAH